MKSTFDVAVQWHATGRWVRRHVVSVEGAGEIQGSAAPRFHGDADRWNPEQLFIASLTQCHMMTFLYLAECAKLEIVSYRDDATGVLQTHPDGSGEFEHITLHPHVVISDAHRRDEAIALHDAVANYCFIERSIAVPVRYVIETSLR